MRTKFNVLCTLKSRGQNRILWQSVDLWTMMPSLSRMIKDDSYCLGWLKEKSFVEQEVVLGCFSLSLLLPTYVPSTSLIKGFLLHDINSLTCGPSQSQKMSAIFSITADINDILASMYLTSIRSFCSSKTSTNFCQRINPKL